MPLWEVPEYPQIHPTFIDNRLFTDDTPEISRL